MIPIVFSTDHNYIMQTGVCIMTLLESACSTTTYKILVIISNDVTKGDQDLLRSQVEKFLPHSIDFLKIGNVFEGCNVERGISVATYSRLLIPWLFPQYDKIIFSDVDVIFRLDLKSVYEIDLENYYAAAIPAISFRTQTNEYGEYLRSINLDPLEYYNAGFLVINSKKQREENLRDAFIRESRNNHIFQDQDIINIVCNGHLKQISPKYCITPTFFELISSNNKQYLSFYGAPEQIEKYKRGEDCVLHYAGPKPWSTFTFAWTDWIEAYRHSVFYNSRFEIELYNKILKPTITWRKILSSVKKKISRCLHFNLH